MYYVYVLQSKTDKDRFYLGYSKELDNRIRMHNKGQTASTSNSEWEIVYYEAYTQEVYARKRERELKRNRRMKEYLLKRVKESLE